MSKRGRARGTAVRVQPAGVGVHVESHCTSCSVHEQHDGTEGLNGNVGKPNTKVSDTTTCCDMWAAAERTFTCMILGFGEHEREDKRQVSCTVVGDVAEQLSPRYHSAPQSQRRTYEARQQYLEQQLLREVHNVKVQLSAIRAAMHISMPAADAQRRVPDRHTAHFA